MKRAIITGATGAIGTALIKELIKNNVEIMIFCRKDSKRINQIPNHHLVDIRHYSLKELKNIRNNINKQYDIFYHLGWDGTNGDARNDMYLQNKNVEFSLDAVKLAKEYGCHTFIGIGSQAEYGRRNEVLNENTPTFPENGYGIAKLCAGYMTRELSHSLGMKHVWVRVLSVYGPNDGKQSLIMTLINKLKNKEIFKCTEGEQIWDYLYSDDAAKALFMIGNKVFDGKTYVLGSGEKKYLKEYILDVKDLIDSKGIIEFGALNYSEKQVMYLCADIRELEKDVGWKPETSFREGIESLLSIN